MEYFGGKYDVIVITSEPQVNNYRQEFEKYAIVYDLTTFTDRKYWLAFINYIIEKVHMMILNEYIIEK